MPYCHFFIRPWLFLIHLGLKHCHTLETINTSVLVAALNMSLPEARSFTLHYPGPQKPSFMLIRPGLLQKTFAVHYCAVNKQGDAALNLRPPPKYLWTHLQRITTKVNPAPVCLSAFNHSQRVVFEVSTVYIFLKWSCESGTISFLPLWTTSEDDSSLSRQMI